MASARSSVLRGVALLLAVGSIALWPGEPRARQVPNAGASAPLDRVVTVVVDAGHGGNEPGAIGMDGTEEKSVTLTAARLLRDMLSANGMRVVLTRDDDAAHPLDERASTTNRAKADLYLTLHANASPSPQSRGAEVAWFAPNVVGAMDRGSLPPAGRFTLVRWDRAQERHVERAAVVAAHLAEALKTAGLLGPRGAYQAPLRGLASVDVPGVVVELGYLSNPMDEARLSSDAGLRALASTLAEGVVGFLRRSR